MFADVDPDSTIAQEEIFGPVLSIIPYDDDDDAVRIANNSKYGLSGMIQSGEQRAGDGRCPPGANRHAVGQRRLVVPTRRSVRRLQAERRSGARTARKGSRSTSRSRPSASRPATEATSAAERRLRFPTISSRGSSRSPAAALTHADRQPGGARKEAWFVDVVRPDDTVDHLFLRYDRSDPAAHRRPVDAAPRSDRVRRAAGHRCSGSAACSPSTPRIRRCSRCDSPVRTGSRASPTTTNGRAPRSDFMTKLAALHRLDPADLDLPAFPTPTTVPDAVRHELDELERVLAQRGGEPDPALSRSRSTGCGATSLPTTRPVVLVQGDTGPGNFMYADGHVVAVVDWELAHLGDPMDDIAWLSLRATQEPLPDFPERLREYATLSGHAIDDRTRALLPCDGRDETAGDVTPRTGSRAPSENARSTAAANADVGNRMIYGVLHRRLWFEAMAAAAGIELTPAEPAPPQPARSRRALRRGARSTPRRDRSPHHRSARARARQGRGRGS